MLNADWGHETMRKRETLVLCLMRNTRQLLRCNINQFSSKAKAIFYHVEGSDEKTVKEERNSRCKYQILSSRTLDDIDM
jgi:hypothetical protein